MITKERNLMFPRLSNMFKETELCFFMLFAFLKVNYHGDPYL